ncbi:unnamed protein product [Arabidopsis halleri]
MGSKMKPTLFNERVATTLKSWHHTSMKQINYETWKNFRIKPFSSRPTTPTHGSSPIHLLHNVPHKRSRSIDDSFVIRCLREETLISIHGIMNLNTKLLRLRIQIIMPKTCISPKAPSKPHTHFPRSNCDSSPRQHLPLPKKNARSWSSKAWKWCLSSFSDYFLRFSDLEFIQNHNKALCLSVGAGYPPMVLFQIGLAYVNAV